MGRQSGGLGGRAGEADMSEYVLVTTEWLSRCHKILGTPGPHFHYDFGDPSMNLGTPSIFTIST